MTQEQSNRVPNLNECYQKAGQRFIVCDNTAGVITLKPANAKKTGTITLYPHELNTTYQRIR